MAETKDMFTLHHDAAHLAHRLREHGVELSWMEIGKEKVRERIIEGGLAEVIVWRGQDGKVRTYERAFEDVFGEALVPKKGRAPKSAAV
jgi:hypothetical protein